MDNALSAAGTVESRKLRLKVGLAALALAFAVVVLVQNRAAEAQIDFSQIFCAALLQVRNAFVNSPFFSFIQGIIDSLLALFHCVISGA